MRDLPTTLKSLLREFRLSGDLEVHERVDLGAWTNLGIGGLGDLLIRCSTGSAAQRAIDLLASHGLRWLVVGSGSRLVPPEAGLRVPLLHLTGELNRWVADADSVTVGAGAKLAQVGGALARSGVNELEALLGEPGTVGGDLRAGAVGERSAILARVEWLELARPGAGILRHGADERDSGRAVGLGEGRAVALRARIRFEAQSPRRAGAALFAGRRPVGPLRGRVAPLVFHDPPGGSASELLSRAGCAGTRVGGAHVPDWSPNAIVATAVCSSRDVASLVRRLRDQVEQRCGVVLSSRLWFVDELGSRFEP